MILPFQKNYPLGCNLSCLFPGPWVNFSGTFILLLKQNQPALFSPSQTFMHSAQTVCATVQTWQVSMRAELLEELKTKYQPPYLPQQPLVKTKAEQINFQRMKKGTEDGKGGEVRTAGGRQKTQPSPRLELMAAASLAWASSFS